MLRNTVIRFFPTELLSTLDPSHAKAPNGAAVTKPKKKSLQLAKANQRTRLEMFEEDADRRIAGEDAEDEDGENRLNDDEEEPEEERDDEFEEDDEEDDSNDYNAEKYFDDGEADDYGGDDDLGGGGDEYY